MCNRWALLFALLFLFGGEATAQTPDPDPNSKSAAEFTLTTCLAAMDDLAKVEVMARENNWTNKTPTLSAALSKTMTSRSLWEVMQGENKFTVVIWINAANLLKSCDVAFPVKNVKREEFLNSIVASMELTLMADERLAERRFEVYEIRSDRTPRLRLNIVSQNDGTVGSAIVSEMQTPPQTMPSTEPR
jgi:hypothetical protein